MSDVSDRWPFGKERKMEGREGRRKTAVNCETLVLNLIIPIVYGGELEWDLQELDMLGLYIMSSM